MNLCTDARIRRAIYFTFAAGAACAAIAPAAVLAQDTKVLEGVQVTGSRIRSVDAQTSNPVFVMDRRAIEATGSTTLGDLLQSIPAATGLVTNAQVNNGGGNGGASVNLRGIGAERTLVLLDGHRVIGTTFSDISYVDLNTIPVNMVERIEVLKQGAAAVYGSDAIGGVVNIITRRNYKGTTLEGTWGETDRGDGMHENINGTWGVSGPKGRVVVGIDFDRNDAINASKRDVTATPTAFYYTQLSPNAGTSSRTPFGKFSVPGFHAAPNPKDADCGNGFFSGVTRIDGTTGSSPSDFRKFCQNFGPGGSDRYNFLSENLLLTPAKRHGMFLNGSYEVTPDISFYGSGFYMHVNSDAQLAPEPFDTGTIQAVISPTAPVPISSKSMYNPFGVDVTNYALRATLAGDRILTSNTSTYQGTVGLKGQLLDKFEWDVGLTYGRIDQTDSDYGYLNFGNLFNQLGPSAMVGGVPTCLDSAGNPIQQCTPLDVFGTTGATVKSLAVTANTFTTQDQEQVLATLNGDLFDLWAGPVSGAAGFEFRSYHFTNTPDALEQSFSLSEANSKVTSGNYNVREVFGEFRVPILADVPGVKSLVLTPGVRYSDYSSFGSTVNAKYGMEYRPYSDLLVRATYTDVFRAPTVNDLFKGALQDSPGFVDPCNNLSAADAVSAQFVNECGPNVAANATTVTKANPTPHFVQSNAQASAVRIGNPNLQPETGFATDFGLFYSASWYKPLSIEVDYYKYKISHNIGLLTTQDGATACLAGQTAECALAGAANRDATGNLNLGVEPTANLGFITTQGVDIGFRLNYPNTPFGTFVFSTDGNYVQSYKSADVFAGIPLSYESLAGQTDGVQSIPRIKITGALYWNKGPFSATIYDRYIGNVREGQVGGSIIDANDDGSCLNTTADTTVNSFGGTISCRRQVGDVNYIDISGTYKYAPFGTSLTVGVTDLGDAKAKFAPSFVFGGGTGYPTDPSLYRFEGRAFFVRMKFEYK